jgi:hypothetical protein
MNKEEKESLQQLLDSLRTDTDQLTFDFDLNSMAAQPALTISSSGIDTISLGEIGVVGASGSLNSVYDFSYNGTSYPSITIGPNTSNLTNGTGTITTNGTGGTGGYGYAIGGGGAGQVLTTGTNGVTWSDFSNKSNTLQVNGDANFEGDIKIKGKSLVDSLEKIEEKLAILRPNEKLEEKWDELRELRNRYMELEKEIIEKEKMWDILKK